MIKKKYSLEEIDEVTEDLQKAFKAKEISLTVNDGEYIKSCIITNSETSMLNLALKSLIAIWNDHHTILRISDYDPEIITAVDNLNLILKQNFHTKILNGLLEEEMYQC